MAYSVDVHEDDSAHYNEHPARRAVPQTVFGGVAIGLIALACGWTVYANVFASQPVDVVAAPTVTVLAARHAEPAVTAVAKQPTAATRPNFLKAPTFEVALLNPAPLGLPMTFGQSAPLRTALVPPPRRVASIPLPMPRPAEALARNAAAQPKFSLASAESTPAATSAFDKIFGKPERGTALAFAAPDGGVTNDGHSKSTGKLPPNDGLTAIYDITARTVHLPDGTKLEAHSGLGPKMDDPRHVNVRMHGATPPHVYDLIPREALFHGVEALRLIPVGGEGAIFGRTGLLTHTYLLGPRGDSNGCISFKDYGTFIQAYKAGKVKRMIVVASIDDPQFDVRLVDRPPPKLGRAYTAAASSDALALPIVDDRYALSLSSSRASRTSWSARSLN